MSLILNQELADAIRETSDGELEVVDPVTRRKYFLVDHDTYHRAMEALRHQQTREAIAEGLTQMERGDGKPLDQAFAELRTRPGFPPPQ